MECSDLSALSTDELARLPDNIHLTAVLNPFGRALKQDVDLTEILAEDPDRGETLLGGFVDKARKDMAEAPDGVLYLLYGARGLHTTPMEYGGHYLERDRELLTEIENSNFNMVFVVGEDDAYLDFVSDLPAHAFGWDSKATGVTVQEMRKMRTGALATNAHNADIELRFGTDSVSAELELQLQETHG